jgi:hypothetical protein
MAGRYVVRSFVQRRRGVARRWYYITNPDGIDTGVWFAHWDTAMFQANKWAQRRKVHAENRALWPV